MPELRGRGVTRELMQILENHVRGNFPKVSRQRLTTTSSHFTNQWKQVLDNDMLFYDVAAKLFRIGIPSTGIRIYNRILFEGMFLQIYPV